MFKDMEEARELLHTAVGINDGYVKVLLRKDSLILELEENIEVLKRRVEELENAYELPRTAEVSQ